MKKQDTGKTVLRKWELEYDNDTGATDESFREFYSLINPKGDVVASISYQNQDEANEILLAVNNYKNLLNENEKIKKLLHELTPGGSEFYNDPEYCAKWIKESRTENHYLLSNKIKDLKEKNAKLLSSKLELIDGLRWCLGRMGSVNWEDAPTDQKIDELRIKINNAKKY